MRSAPDSVYPARGREILSDNARALFDLTRLKLLAQPLGLTKIQAADTGATLRFGEQTTIDPFTLVSMVEDEPESYALDGPFKLRVRWQLETENERMGAIEELLIRLGARSEASAAA